MRSTARDGGRASPKTARVFFLLAADTTSASARNWSRSLMIWAAALDAVRSIRRSLRAGIWGTSRAVAESRTPVGMGLRYVARPAQTAHRAFLSFVIRFPRVRCKEPVDVAKPQVA